MCSYTGVYAIIREFRGQRFLKRRLKGEARGIFGGESGGQGRYYRVREFAIYTAVASVVANVFRTGAARTGEEFGKCTGDEEEGSEAEGGGLHCDSLMGELGGRCCGSVKVDR